MMRWIAFVVGTVTASSLPASMTAQIASGQHKISSTSTMQQHYDAAYSLQSSGKSAEAAQEHKLFLAEALHRVANARANIGEYQQAVPLYEEALHFKSDDFTLRVDYAEAAFDAEDNTRASVLAQSVLNLAPRSGVHDTKALLVLGKGFWQIGQHDKAIEEFKAAVAINPNFDNSFTLARATLLVGNKEDAKRRFAGILAKFGSTPATHLKIGQAYASVTYYLEADQEFKDAVAEDNRYPGAHYSLGATYINRLGEAAYPQAEVEFHKELGFHPDDAFSYSGLGRIAMYRHNYKEAEVDLERAVTLDPHMSDTFILLGQLYTETRRPLQAEIALRHAIAETPDPSRDHYAIHKAHYLLGRLLAQDGNVSEGKKELQTAAEEVAQSKGQDEVSLTEKAPVQVPLQKTRVARPIEVEEERAFEESIGPLIAGSYNNLGVDAATDHDFVEAAGYFKEAADWNPHLHGLDNNWGRATFAAHEYAQAAAPLSRSLKANPQDLEIRLDLGLSQYMTHDYIDVLKTLQPIEASFKTAPPFAIIYADSTLKTGDVDQGMQRLQLLEQSNPDDEVVHRALGEGQMNAGDYQRAEEELRTAVHINPSDADAVYSLALDLTASGKKHESEMLLTKLAAAGSQDARVYYELGKMKLDSGDAKAAIDDLQKAVKIDPANDAARQALMMAYARSSSASARDAK